MLKVFHSRLIIVSQNDSKMDTLNSSHSHTSVYHSSRGCNSRGLRRKLKRKLKEFQLSDLLNWRENGSDVEKAFNLGEPPHVPLSSYPLLISLIIPPNASSLGDF